MIHISKVGTIKRTRAFLCNVRQNTYKGKLLKKQSDGSFLLHLTRRLISLNKTVKVFQNHSVMAGPAKPTRTYARSHERTYIYRNEQSNVTTMLSYPQAGSSKMSTAAYLCNSMRNISWREFSSAQDHSKCTLTPAEPSRSLHT